MKRLTVALLLLSGCAHSSIRPDYYSPTDCRILRESARKAETVEEASSFITLGFAAGGTMSEALKTAKLDTGPLTLILAGAGLLAGAVWKGADSYAKNSAAEHVAYCTVMPVPVPDVVVSIP